MAEYHIYSGKLPDGVFEWVAIEAETAADGSFAASDYFHAGTLEISKMGEIDVEGDTHLLPESFDVSGT